MGLCVTHQLAGMRSTQQYGERSLWRVKRRVGGWCLLGSRAGHC
jgi:hypothetical protein